MITRIKREYWSHSIVEGGKMVIRHESWMILAQCSWLLLFLLLLLFLCCLGLGLSLLVLLNQLIHLKKKKMLEQNKGNYLWDHKHIIMTFLFTWSAGRILIWVFPFSLKYWISAAIELDIMFFRQGIVVTYRTWWELPAQSFQEWAWSCQGSCSEPAEIMVLFWIPLTSQA